MINVEAHPEHCRMASTAVKIINKAYIGSHSIGTPLVQIVSSVLEKLSYNVSGHNF